MAGRVAVVTDSSAYLSGELVARYGLGVVPLQLSIAGQSYDDGQVSPGDVGKALREWVPVTTSRPSPERFAEVYAAAAVTGASGVVSLHLSSAFSGATESAALAAAEAGIPVRVVDTRSIGMGAGFAVLAAAAAAAGGASMEEVVSAADRCARATRVFFYVDTLEYLRRGGRIGAAASLIGSALMIKPLLHIVDGKIVPLEKVRTTSRAIARLEDLAVQAAADRHVDVAVQHLDNERRAALLADRLRHRISGLRAVHVGEVGAAIGAHVGPGLLAVVVAPSQS